MRSLLVLVMVWPLVGCQQQSWRLKKRRSDDAATTWIRGQVEIAAGELEAGDAERAFSMLSSLTREAKRRTLTDLDQREVQPILARAVFVLVPKVMAAPLAARDAPGALREAKALLAVVDPELATLAHGKAVSLLSEFAQQERKLANEAAAAGRPAAAYLHGALAEDYGLAEKPSPEQARRARALDELAGTAWKVDPPTCKLLDKPLETFVRKDDTAGKPATLSFEVSSCTLDVERQEVTEQKSFQRRIAGRRSVSQAEGSWERSEICGPDGRCTSGGTTGRFIEGKRTEINTEDSYVDTEGTAVVTNALYTWKLNAKVVVEASGEPRIEVPISFADQTEETSWGIREAVTGDRGWSQPADEKRRKVIDAELQAKVGAAIDTAAQQARQRRGAVFAAAMAAAPTPEVAEELAISAIRAAGVEGAPAQLLAERYRAPASDLRVLIVYGKTNAIVSPLAYKLEIPKTIEGMGVEVDLDPLEDIRFRDGGRTIELAAALAHTGVASGRTTSAASESANGIGVGLVWGTTFDPGSLGNGWIFSAAMDLRAGYAGGLFYDTSVPLELGRRIGRLGVTGLLTGGFDKLGSRTEPSLYVNVAPYGAYGVGLSYLTPLSFDVNASYMSVARSGKLAAIDEPTISDESRFEVRLIKFSPARKSSVYTVTGRYTTYAGSMHEGSAITVWLGFANR